MFQTLSLGHVQRHPAAALVEHFQRVMRQEVEDAGCEVAFMRRVGREHLVVRLDAQGAGAVQPSGQLVGGPLRPQHDQVLPRPPRALGGEVPIARVDVPRKARVAHRHERDLPVRKDYFRASLKVGGIDRL